LEVWETGRYRVNTNRKRLQSHFLSAYYFGHLENCNFFFTKGIGSLHFPPKALTKSASIPVRKSCLKKIINCRYVSDMESDVSGTNANTNRREHEKLASQIAKRRDPTGPNTEPLKIALVLQTWGSVLDNAAGLLGAYAGIGTSGICALRVAIAAVFRVA
jgi:hypothetical protein